jgi:NAD+ kinase
MARLVMICPNPYRDKNLQITRQVQSLLKSSGFETAICPVFDSKEYSVVPKDIQKSDIIEMSMIASLMVVIGGDGTLLHAARYAAKYRVPVIGINAGTKGFMTVIDPKDYELVLKAAKGDYLSDKRMMIDITLKRNGEIIYSDSAINDAVIHGMGDCIGITVWCDGDKMSTYSGDGIIFSTPTGSTAYSLSAGGPIVEPAARCLVMTPICVHGMMARSIILSPERELIARAERLHGRRAQLIIDGNKVMALQNDDILRVKISQQELIIADLGIRSFYDITFEKLIERL